MADTFNFSSTPSFGVGQTNRADVVWPTVAASQPQRHPSRPKRPYRPRGRSVAATPSGQTPPSDHRAVWAAQIHRARSMRKQRSVAIICATCVGFCIGLGGLAALQSTAPTPQVTIASLPLQQAPTLVPGTFSETLDFTQPANLGAAPSVNASSPDLTVVPMRQSAPARPGLPLASGQPSVLDAAPMMGSAPVALDRPTLRRSSAATFERIPPAQPVLPATVAPFVCADCTFRVPPFDGVTFTVQTPDQAATGTRQLMAALSGYEVDLQTSAISFDRSEVRFYRAADAASAQILAAQYDAQLVDLSWVASQSDIPRVEIILGQSVD